jgi:uncharacterized protein
MIIYQENKKSFLEDMLTNNIENKILSLLKDKTGGGVGESEINSWKNSLMYMNNVLIDTEIPDNSGIAIEFKIPQSSNRIDFIITGEDESNIEHAVIIELKQWDKAEKTELDGIVNTRFKSGPRDTTHPSYQAWSYASVLNSYNETVYEDKIQLKPCAFLHNYTDDGVISDLFYSEYIEKAPLFFKSDLLKLRQFIKQFVKKGDTKNIMYRIDNGKIRPSKSLADSLSKMLKGNQEFILIEDQKVVYQVALDLAKKSNSNCKNVLIVEGGPGTGKSVVAINLLVQLTKNRKLINYVTKNAAPRAVYHAKLTGSMKKSDIENMFTGSGQFTTTERNTFDALVVDEAHRLNAKSGLYGNLGENQVKELIDSSKFSVFFIDEDQKVTWTDIGTKDEIEKWAEILNCKVHNLKLSSQFRCNGSDGYLAWLDNTLGINETDNKILDIEEYDFKIMNSPQELREKIFEKNLINNKARIVAGYCWEWISKKNPNSYDIVIDDFKMRWNLGTDGMKWIIAPTSVNEVGCIHTCQGLETDYIGVIVGDDFIIRNGQVICNALERAKGDKSIRGYKSQFKTLPFETKIKADAIIKNTYRTLMTRGMKGCYVYFTDKETELYFKQLVKK